MSAIRIAIVLWGGLFLLLSPLRPLSDGDLYWQRWLGEVILRTGHLPAALGPETFSAPGAAWVPQEWLLSIVVALAMRGNLYVPLTLLFALIPIAILVSIYVRSRERASPVAIGIVLLLCGIALEASFGVRAQVLGWGCFAAFLYFLQRRDGWYYATVLVVVVWANVHASAALAPAFLAARIAGEMFDGGFRAPAAQRDLRILPLTLLALFCTPLTWHLPAYAVALATSPIRHYIQEWQPVGPFDLEFVAGSLPLAIFAVAATWRKPFARKGEMLPLVLLFVAMLTARRQIPVFAIAAAPLAACGLDALLPKLRDAAARIARLEKPAIASACIAVALAGAAYALGQRASDPRALTNAIAAVDADGAPHRLFCENFSTCSAALGVPRLRIFMDGRCDPYPLAVWRSYMATIRVEPAWRDLFERYRVDAVIATRGTRFAKAMARDTDWRRTLKTMPSSFLRRPSGRKVRCEERRRLSRQGALDCPEFPHALRRTGLDPMGRLERRVPLVFLELRAHGKLSRDRRRVSPSKGARRPLSLVHRRTGAVDRIRPHLPGDDRPIRKRADLLGTVFGGLPMWVTLPVVFLAVAAVMAFVAQGVARAYCDVRTAGSVSSGHPGKLGGHRRIYVSFVSWGATASVGCGCRRDVLGAVRA